MRMGFKFPKISQNKIRTKHSFKKVKKTYIKGNISYFYIFRKLWSKASKKKSIELRSICRILTLIIILFFFFTGFALIYHYRAFFRATTFVLPNDVLNIKVIIILLKNRLQVAK